MKEEKFKELLNELGRYTTEEVRPDLCEEIKQNIPSRLPRHKINWDTISIIIDFRLSRSIAAAVIIIAIALSISIWDKSIPTAYALEETIEANNSVRYIHIKSFTPSHKEPKEFWVECDESGKLKKARWHMPEWDSPEDGAKVVVWKENKIQLWFKGTTKKKNKQI